MVKGVRGERRQEETETLESCLNSAAKWAPLESDLCRDVTSGAASPSPEAQKTRRGKVPAVT